MELGVTPQDRALTLSDLREQLADVASHAADVGANSVTRLVEQRADAKFTYLLLTLYAGAGSCFSLRTTDGERPVRRRSFVAQQPRNL